MSYGFSALNNNSEILIDDTYTCYQLYSYGVGYTNSDGSGLLVSKPADGLIFISPATYDNSIIYNVMTDEGNNAETIYATDHFLTYDPTLGNISKQVYFLVLRPIDKIITNVSGFGLNIYNSNGNIVYSSVFESVIFNQIITKTQAAFSFAGQDVIVNIPTSRTYIDTTTLRYTEADSVSSGGSMEYKIYPIFYGVRYKSSTTINLCRHAPYGGDSYDIPNQVELPMPVTILLGDF